ncbi:hypothetical protein L873DRAFT_138754 [Choiromyces venosus 120613-1]|uniref:Uncharacterized protein n=1 Tax=Choiromyces venosus 120613-1 TaxID=1336337 RepID=A0A3N4J3X9_9PEZI|nr:hypothetical protein L873DRAFT_138754 [Choiromyces venosus 120613-1]
MSEPPQSNLTAGRTFSLISQLVLADFVIGLTLLLLTKHFTHLCATTLSSLHSCYNSVPSPQQSPLPKFSQRITYSY